MSDLLTPAKHFYASESCCHQRTIHVSYPTGMGIEYLCSMANLLTFLTVFFAHGQGTDLTNQIQCLCEITQDCDKQNYWVLHNKNKSEVFVTVSSQQPSIYSLEYDKQSISSLRSNIGLLEIPSINGTIPVVVRFDQQGNYRSQTRLYTDLETLHEELAHWEKMSRLEDILFQQNGVPLNAKDRGLGTRLIVFSDRVGLSKTPEMLDGMNLQEMIEAYDKGFAQARQFEQQNQDLFSACHSGGRTLCNDGPNIGVKLSEQVSSQGLNAWSKFYKPQVVQAAFSNYINPNTLCQFQTPTAEEQNFYREASASAN